MTINSLIKLQLKLSQCLLFPYTKAAVQIHAVKTGYTTITPSNKSHLQHQVWRHMPIIAVEVEEWVLGPAGTT